MTEHPPLPPTIRSDKKGPYIETSVETIMETPQYSIPTIITGKCRDPRIIAAVAYRDWAVAAFKKPVAGMVMQTEEWANAIKWLEWGSRA